MSNADVVIVGSGELQLITELYNEIFRPPKVAEFFTRRLLGRHNPLILIANVERRPVGFAIGFELKPTVYYSWLNGVLPDFRRAGIASQLQEAQAAWAAEHHYHYMRMECHNRHRPILHMVIATGFNIVGVRWDNEHQENLIIFEKAIKEA